MLARSFIYARGTCTNDIVSQSTITGEVQRLLAVFTGEMKRRNIQEALALRHEEYFREAYFTPALNEGLVEMTIPDKPTSSKKIQAYTEGSRFSRETGVEGEKTRGKKGEGRGK